MATPEKRTTIRELGALGGVAAKIRIGELQSMDRKQFSKLVKDTLEPEKRIGTQSELINRIMEAEARAPIVKEGQGVSIEPVDVEESEPEVNNELESSQGAVLDVVHSPGIVAEESKESSSDRLERENKITRFAREVEQGNFPSKPESIAFFNENEEKILGEVKFIKEGRVKNNELEQARRRKTSDKPFPPPAISKPAVKEEVTPVESKIVEAPKAEPVLPEVPPERFKPLHQDQLGKASKLEPKPEIDTEKEVERIARKIFEAKEELTPSEYAFRGNHPEIAKRAWELHEEAAEGKSLNETVKPLEILDKEKEPAPKLEPVNVLTGGEKDSRKENEKPTIDGLVAFNLGKLGIKEEDLAREVPNFLNMSPEKQNYILDRLNRKVHKDLNMESEAELKSKDAAAKAKNKGFIGGIKNFGISIGQGLTRNTRQRLIRDSMKGNLEKGGLASYKDSLKALTDFVETRGLDIKENDKGQKVLQFLQREGADDGHKKLLAAFNEIASNRAEMPMAWSAPEAKKALREKAREIEREYKKAQQRLFQYELRQGSGEANNGKVIDFVQIDRAVEMNRLLTHNPEITSFAGGIIRDYKLDNKFSHMALGASVRGLFQYGVALGGNATALATMGSGILGASLTGGVVGVLNKKKEFRTAMEQKRSGIGDKTKIQGVAGVIDAGDYIRRMEGLIQKISDTPAGKKREQLAQSLQNRIHVAEQRMDLQAVNWGKGEKEYLNKFELFSKIGKAADFLVEESGITREAAYAVYKKFDKIHFRDAGLSAERKKELGRAFLKGATWGGVGAVLGLEANDWLRNDGQLTKAGIDELIKSNNDMALSSVSSGLETNRINPTSETAGQPANFPGNMPRPESLPYDATEIVSPAPTPVVESSFGSRGAIGMIKDVQRALVAQYGDNMPANFKEFAEGNPDRIAMDWGMYRPEDMNESISLPKGTTLAVMPDGSTVLKLPDGTVIDGDFKADFFDSGARAESLASQSNPNNVGETMTRTGVPGAETSPDGLVSDPTHVGDVQNTNNSVYGKGGFDEYKAARISQGWEHTADGANGDVFTAAVDPQAAREYAPGFYPEDDTASTEPEVVPEYGDIDGLKVDSKELKGTVDFLYDSKGQVTGVDLPKLNVEDVSRFRATPERFIGGEHNAPERVLLTKKLLTVRSEVETYLKYRRIMEIKSLSHDTDEYRFLNNESNRLWSAIQKKVEYQFNPQYSGVDGNPIENTGGAIAQEQAPVNSTIESPRAESTSEFVKTGRDSIRLESQVYIDAAARYGGATVIDGNVVEFKDGYVGFYGESSDQAQAARECRLAAETNTARLGAPVDTIAYQDQVDGKYRVLFVYKKP